MLPYFDNADASSPSKLDNSGGDEDTTTRPTTANVTLRHVHVNAIADYYNIPQLKDELSARLIQLWAYFNSQDLWFQLLREGILSGPEWLCQLTKEELSFI